MIKLYKNMLIVIFNNIYTPFGLINRAKYQVIDNVLADSNMSNF